MTKTNAEYWDKLKKWGEETGSKLSLTEIREIYFDENMKHRVLVLSEHDGDRYFDASTSEKTLAAFLRVLWERFDKRAVCSWFDARETLTERRQEAGIEVPDFTEEQIPNLPLSLQKTAKERLKSYKEQSATLDANGKYLALVVQALDEKDGELAYLAIRKEKPSFNFRYMVKVDRLPVEKIELKVCAGCGAPYYPRDAKKVILRNPRVDCGCPCGSAKAKFPARKPWNVPLPEMKGCFGVPSIDTATRAMAKIISERTGD